VILERMRELARHSAVYGFGTLVARIVAVPLLALYTRYLSPGDYGAIETLLSLSAILTVLLGLGIKSAFFRFYFDSDEEAQRVLVVRTAFWFTMVSATAGLVAGLLLAEPISQALFASSDRASLVRASFVALWAQMNYEQMTSLFRVEQRSTEFVVASLANVTITIALTIALVVAARLGAVGVIVGNFSGTLVVYVALLAYRRYQLGLQFDRELFRELNRFGMPLVPSALALWVMNFSDRFFLVKLSGAREVGLYSIGVRIASVTVLVLTAFRTAWPAFAYSISDDDEARRTYGYVLTYLCFVTSWLALTLGLLAPWLVRLLTTPSFYDGARVVAPLAFAGVAFGGYIVVVIGIGRVRLTGSNWTVTGAGAAVNAALNLLLIPRYGMMGAAVATIAAYMTLFGGMAWRAQRLYPVPYQWRRIAIAAGAAIGLTIAGKTAEVSLAVAILLCLAYPLVLVPFGFYLPAELRQVRAAGRRLVAFGR
jgi:O-antigen/teichoic acid export membrane protein